MMVLNMFLDKYHELWRNGDPRVNDWPMMTGPLPTIAICLAYVFIVKVIGPKLMQNKQPFQLRRTMMVYNFCMVLVSAYLFYKMGKHGWFGKYDFRCQPVDYSQDDDAIGMVHIAWWYYISKFVEFLDTIFFVLRKKNDHISALHVVHHGIMPMSVWWGLKFTPGGHTIGPHMYKYLWWKKYMTTVQMIQFICIFVHSFQLLFRSCNYPRSFMWWIGFHSVLFWQLFSNFYREEYYKKRGAKKGQLKKFESVKESHKACLVDKASNNNYDNTTNNNNNNNSHSNNNNNYDKNNLRKREVQA